MHLVLGRFFIEESASHCQFVFDFLNITFMFVSLIVPLDIGMRYFFKYSLSVADGYSLSS